MYTRSYFPLPQDKDYYIVGFLANIVNKIHTHHFVAYFCSVGINQLYDPPQRAGFPEQPKNKTDLGMAVQCSYLNETVLGYTCFLNSLWRYPELAAASAT
jgi:hypothetical protein